jgi:hypothetical protein
MITRKSGKTTLLTIEDTAEQRQVIARDCLDPTPGEEQGTG